MRYGSVPGIDKPVSRLAQGTVMISSRELERSFELLDGIFAQGCNTFDTAHQYGAGDCERVLGRWIADRGIRDQVVIVTKGAHHNQDRRRVTPWDITADLFDSLARLRTDCIDLYLLHRDDPTVPVGPIVEVLNAHLSAGRIRAFGGSNWSIERLMEANKYAKANNLTPFAVSSPNLSLAEQYQEPWAGCVSIGGERGRKARAWYQATQTPLFAWSSLAGGFFSGRFTRDNLDTMTHPLDRVCVHAYCYEDNFKRLERAQALAARRGLTTPQVALAYVLNQPLNVFAIVGCNTVAEFAENLAASEIKLTPEELAQLEVLQ
ncbi:MAG: aldo/keto reductase [Anaerolineae bacterium]